MGRERWGQLLVSLGLTAMVLSLLGTVSLRQFRDADRVQAAAPELLQVPSVRAAVTAEFARSIERAYYPSVLTPDTLEVAASRMADNGYVIEDFERAVGMAHRGWLDGGELLIDLDPRIVTQAAVTGLRDADVAVADAFPSNRLVEPNPIVMPWDTTASSIADTEGRVALGALVGLVMFGLGAVVHSRRGWTLKLTARAVVIAALLVAISAVVLPLSALRDVDDRIAVLGALVAPQLIPLLVVSAIAIFIGMWIHAVADRAVNSVERRLAPETRAKKKAAPVESGTRRPAKGGAKRHRSEAIDAFFEPKAEREPAQVIDARIFDDDEFDLTEAAEVGDSTGEEPGDTETEAQPLTPEQERAAELAAERREQLERIDGTRSRYRTHLPR